MKFIEINNELLNTIYRMTRTKTGYPSIDKTHEKGLSFFKKHPIVPNISIYHGLSLISSFYRKANALNCFDLNTTYQELLDESVVLSKSFKELGIRENDIITICMPNFGQAVSTFFAANRIGATVAILNPGTSVEETQKYLNLYESPLFIDYNKNIKYNQKIKQETKVKNIITVQPEDLNPLKTTVIQEKISSYSDYLNYRDMKIISEAYKKPIKSNYSGSQNALILLTSGSTGTPKSVVLTNKNILATGINLKNSSNIKSEVGEKTLVCVPFCYPYGFVTSTLMSLLCGREAILAPDIGPRTINYYLDKRPDMIFGSPALLEMMIKHTEPDRDISSVSEFVSGGDFLTKQLREKTKIFCEEHGTAMNIGNGSGNGETSGSGTNPVGIENRPDTVGKVLVGTSAIVIDTETEQELKYNEEGQLCIAGSNVFKEYYKEPELTEKAKFKYKGKEYFKTGSRGKLDEDGYFTLTARDSRFYITSTLNKVYCDHVQQVISQINTIEACAVVKKPDEESLYVNKAYVVLKQGVLPTEEEKENIWSQITNQFLEKNTDELIQLKEYEIPESIEFIEELPQTPANKIDYALLEEKAISNVNLKVKKR